MLSLSRWPRSMGRHLRRTRVVSRVFEREYLRAFYEDDLWREVKWMGVPIWKCPLDLWLYQEIVFAVRPQLIVETGTAHGGSTLYLAQLCDLLGQGEVVSIDVAERATPNHPRITYLFSSSVAPNTVAEVRRRAAGRITLVILDSDHSAEHVLAELEAYHSVVSPGSYLIVEDGIVNGHPVESNFGPGPLEATQRFLSNHPEFAHDSDKDRFRVTFNPSGFLRRASEATEFTG